jgi:hypothetical protein
MNIYLDTNMWDALFDGGVQPEEFVPRLTKANKRLVLGLHAFYESVRIFQSAHPDALTRGRALLEFVGRYLDMNILCAKDQSELLPAEMLALKEGAHRVEYFYPQADREKIVMEYQQLSNGFQSDIAKSFVEDQLKFAKQNREGIVAHLEAHPELIEKLSSIPAEDVEIWLQQESVSARGHSNLSRHIALRFPELPEREISECAVALLRPPMMRFARGLVRADLYLHWRYAQFKALRKDLLDDVYHVLNASYCNSYATADSKQHYAPLLLTSNTKVRIWPRSTPVDEWLERLS